ncbi:patatin-like phospholipase family protein [Nocardioidaceae bacterium]|nr:patatin-like phospholipase family protein [Nocardioidaceae bacterium]
MSGLRADLVMEGGGVLGIGHVGVIDELERAGYDFERVAGSSVGSLVGALVAAGMPAARMVELMRETDFRRFTDRSLVDRVPVLGPIASLLLDDGVYEGDWLHEFVGDVLAERGVVTFGDLRRGGDEAPLEERWKLVVTVTDVTRGLLVRLPWDYQRVYGLDPDEQPVADAVRASTAIPFFFEPASLTAADGTTSTLVDGGVLSNFPIDVLDRTGPRPPRWPTFGIKLVPDLPADGPALLPVLNLVPGGGPLALLSDLVTTTLVGRDQARLSLPWVAARTIRVDTSGVNPVDFRLSDADKERLLEGGRSSAESFLARWDWEAYKERFRNRREG